MKLFLLAILTSTVFVSCSKDDAPPPKTSPEVNSIRVASDNTTPIVRPKLIFNLTVPDPSKTVTLYIIRFYQTGGYFYIDSVQSIHSPVSKEYAVIDTTTIYPYSYPSTYIFGFLMKDSVYANVGVKGYMVQ